MKITHFSNSFILVESKGRVICCDPWVGRANYGGWHSFPEFNKKELISHLENVDLVYISHIHDDHFDPQFLIESGLIQKKFIVKKFTFKTLFNRLKSIGVVDIQELEQYTKFSFGGLVMSILPQISSNSDTLDEDVEYDLDTSLVISDGTHTFFNQVDNPYSAGDYVFIKDWINSNYGDITIAALMAGAASEYPHTFLNINRLAERSRVINNSLKKLVDKLDILKPNYYFPAGGTYIIPGKLHALNSLIAQPSNSQIIDCLNQANLGVIFLQLEGGKSVEITSNSPGFKVANEILPTCLDNLKSIDNHKKDLYDYEQDVIEFQIDTLKDLFETAAKNWKIVLAKKEITVEQDISFILHKELILSQNFNLILGEPVGQFELSSNLEESKGQLKIHIDYRSFYLCLTRKKVWNGTLGALCLFEREPNIFFPSATFSLNYLVV
jgi:L-ascorbate metabolism protein UlaG (beta-lactamase superfamily)